jgi:hypothetical protein
MIERTGRSGLYHAQNILNDHLKDLRQIVAFGR